MTLDREDLRRMLFRVCQAVQEKKDWLSRLDAACGDGDHGVSMARGFLAVEKQLSAQKDISPGGLLRKTGTTLLSSVGGATGPLMGTIFIEAGKSVGELDELDTPALSAMFSAGLDGMCKRGGAKAGDKTMVDALLPAVEALQAAAAEGVSPCQALEHAVCAAQAGAASTTEMTARQGKARYMGERAVGHPDAGAYSIVTIFEAFAEAAGEAIKSN
jgi:dihydroxyacetone kinase-like protein